MAVVVEDGTIVANATSYVSEAELTAYATARGVTLVTNTTQLLIRAMDYIESLGFIGMKSTQDQPLQWPRSEVYIDGYYFPNDEIPDELKNGQLATAVAIDEGNDPLAVVPRNIKRKKAEGLEIEYMDGASSVAINKTITNSLHKILSGSGMSGFKVSKA